MTWLWVALGTAAIQLVLAEVFDWFPWLARRLIHRAAALLPAADRARYEEEWLAELDALPGRRISTLILAASILANAPRTRRVLSTTNEESSLRRALDVAAAGVSVGALAPSLAVIGLAICSTSGGSPLSVQSRLGRGGHPFPMYKFRTTGTTRIGGRDLLDLPLCRILRRTALDELPLLWNVLRGDMSLIGPPPKPVELRGSFTADELAIKPGMTSWTILACAGYLPFDEAQRRDQEHHEAWSLRKDVALMLATARAALLSRRR